MAQLFLSTNNLAILCRHSLKKSRGKATLRDVGVTQSLWRQPIDQVYYAVLKPTGMKTPEIMHDMANLRRHHGCAPGVCAAICCNFASAWGVSAATDNACIPDTALGAVKTCQS